MTAACVHPALVRARAEFDAGQPNRLIAIALRSRDDAHQGVFCQCVEPMLFGYALMCEICLHHNQDAERSLLLRMASPHDVVDGRHERQRRLGMCDLCANFADHPVHHGHAQTLTTLWGETVQGLAA